MEFFPSEHRFKMLRRRPQEPHEGSKVAQIRTLLCGRVVAVENRLQSWKYSNVASIHRNHSTKLTYSRVQKVIYRFTRPRKLRVLLIMVLMTNQFEFWWASLKKISAFQAQIGVHASINSHVHDSFPATHVCWRRPSKPTNFFCYPHAIFIFLLCHLRPRHQWIVFIPILRAFPCCRKLNAMVTIFYFCSLLLFAKRSEEGVFLLWCVFALGMWMIGWCAGLFVLSKNPLLLLTTAKKKIKKI